MSSASASPTLVAAWVLLQVVDVLLPIFELPLWVPRLIVLLLAVGFVVALFVAWAYELTPEGIKRDKDIDRAESITHQSRRKLDFLIVGILALALAYFVVDKFLLSDAPQEVVDFSVDVERKSIAVLPFVNMSPDPDQEYFADGLSEEILNLLARIPGLKVIGRTSSFAFKGKNEDLRVIGEALGVKTVLEGSVRKSGDRVRITAQLIDASDGSHIWSATYNRTMTDIFVLQDDVATAIIDALQIHVGVKPTRGRPTESPEAYSLFLKARAAASIMDWQDAEELLLNAIELDPKFAEAYEILTFTYWNLGGDVEDQKLVHDTAAKAVALDPGLVLAQTLYQLSAFGPYTHLRAIRAYEQAARQQPDSPWILEGLVFLLAEYGYLEEALRFAERFVELDPLSLIARSHLGSILYAVGRTSDAIEVLEFANRTELDPDFFKWTIAGVNLVENRDETAIAHFESWLQQHDYPDPTWFRDLLTVARNPASGQAYLDRRIPEIVASMADDDKRTWQRGLISLYLFLDSLIDSSS